MPANDSPDVLVARFLLANNYHETFQAFVRETNLTPDSITTSPDDLTIEKILEEKKLYDFAVRFEKLNLAAGAVDFSVPYPSSQTTLTTSLTTSNILSITLSSFLIPSTNKGADLPAAGRPQTVIISTSADKNLRIYDACAPHDLLHTSPVDLHAGPILSVVAVSNRWLITGSMAGDIAISDLAGTVFQRWEGHKKFVVKLAISEPISSTSPEGASDASETAEVRYLAAASYDKSLSIHKLHIPHSKSHPPRLEFLHALEFPQTVEDVLFSKDFADTSPSSSAPLLIATIRDSAYLHIYTPTPHPSQPFALSTKASLTATSTTWLTYTPTSLTPHPQHPHLLALLTSSLPAPKLLIYNLQTRAVDSAISVPVTLSAFSTGIVAWRGDTPASGVWVNGDDGVVKCVELRSGEVKAELKAHDGRKVRCLVGGSIPVDSGDDGDEEELLVSGGFDGTLKVWKVPKEV
ncbi:hypothetical protein TWF696_004315 [Orbilia brochopaga]|uniref:LisH domain-containing protein n=1 Tax=Orbilia brochopaga TaxID=3140254 RepID=A0AAV9V9L6_9PEZI